MRIESIHLQNYRVHRDLTVKFDPHFNVIVGLNGSGKTSLLRAICDSLNWVTPFQRTGGGPLEEGVAREVIHVSSGRYRFASNWPVSVEIVAKADDVETSWHIRRKGLGESVELDRQIEFKSLTKPILAFYGASRYWQPSSISEFTAATQKESIDSAYRHWFDASLDSSALIGWSIAKSLQRFQTSSETGELFDKIKSDELEQVNAALRSAVEGAKGMRYDLKRTCLLIEWLPVNGKSPEPTRFENLSDGQRAIVCMISDIARRMCLLNPHLGEKVTLETPGLVLIDELDLHLHPHWQRVLTVSLKKVFPAVQFIVSSHSPQVLGELKPEEIILLRPEGTERPQVSYGLDASQVLQEIMGTESRTHEVEAAVQALYESLERNDLQDAKKLLDDLRSKARGIPALSGAEALLRRKQALGK